MCTRKIKKRKKDNDVPYFHWHAHITVWIRLGSGRRELGGWVEPRKRGSEYNVWRVCGFWRQTDEWEEKGLRHVYIINGKWKFKMETLSAVPRIFQCRRPSARSVTRSMANPNAFDWVRGGNVWRGGWGVIRTVPIFRHWKGIKLNGNCCEWPH